MPESRHASQAATTKLLKQYALMCCNGKVEVALQELKKRLGERVTFERNTVFKEVCISVMIRLAGSQD